MATQKNKADVDGETEAQALGGQISVTSRAEEITGRVVGVELDELIEGQQVSVVQDVGLVSGTLTGVKIGAPSSEPVYGRATTDNPPRRGLAKLLARILRRP